MMDYPSAPGSGGDGVYNGRRRLHFNSLEGTNKWNVFQRTNRVYGIHEDNTSGNLGQRLINALSSGRGRTTRLYFDKMDAAGVGGTHLGYRPWNVNSDDGYDRFGRVSQMRWDDWGSATDAVLLNYGYDAGSNRSSFKKSKPPKSRPSDSVIYVPLIPTKQKRSPVRKPNSEKHSKRM